MVKLLLLLAAICISRFETSKLESLLYKSKQGQNEGVVNGARRVTRNAELPSIHVEIGAYVDTDYNDYLESNGLKTLQQKFDAMVLKYTSPAALFGLKEQLGYSVTLSLKYLEIWPTNPSWYVLSDNLQATRTAFCQNVTHTADVLVLHTRQDQHGSNVKGLAPVGGVCGDRKCAIENTGILTSVILAHEIAHLLGTVHSQNADCSVYDTPSGIMESNNLRWNECNAALMNATVGTKSCLTTYDVTTTVDTSSTSMYADIEFNGTLAGQMYSDDKICELLAGPGSWLRAFPRSRTYCGPVSCARNVEGGTVVLKTESYIPGRYCGRNGDSPKICFKLGGKCNDVADTDLKFVQEKQGVWSDYGSWSSCSVTCGTGIQFRKRDCDNPVPVNSPFCEGSQYDLRKCTITHPNCSGGDSDVDLTQVRQTTCGNLGELVNENVTIKTSGHGQCEVTCSYSTALLPDGTPCTISGIKNYCVQGYCEDFSAVSQIMKESTDYTIPGQTNKEIIARIPAGASDVEFEFLYDDMEQNYLEIWTMENVKVMSPTSQSLYHTDGNPIFFASTYWDFDSREQYLRSEKGLELTEPAFIKLHQKGSNENVGILYRYVQPVDDDCTGSCSNSGTWNSDLCSCDCPAGYYGQTCASTCNQYCFNGYPLDSSCNCECDASVTYGDNCRCQYAFTGKNCSECREPTNSLANNCRPTNCQAGCGGLDCKETCEDSANNCANKKSNGKCSHYKSEKNCQLTCDYCESSATAVDCSSGK